MVVDSPVISRYRCSMNTTIPLAFLSPDEAARSVWTDDEDLSDSDPVADHAGFVAYLYADEDDGDYNAVCASRTFRHRGRLRSVLVVR